MDYLTEKTRGNEGEIPQYYVEGDHEAIIDPAVFDRVQIELEKRCSGKIKCGHCGGSLYGSKGSAQHRQIPQEHLAEQPQYRAAFTKTRSCSAEPG